MVHVKGSRIIPRIKFIHERDPGGVWERILDDLDPEFVRQLQNGVIASQWYPLEHYIQLHRAIDRRLGKGDLALCWEMGKRSALEAFTGMYKVFFKVGSAEFVMASGPVIWKQLYDSGRLRIQNESAADSKHYRMIIEGFEQPAEEIWMILAGWVEGALEITGVKDMRVSLANTRVCPGSNCEIEAVWRH